MAETLGYPTKNAVEPVRKFSVLAERVGKAASVLDDEVCRTRDTFAVVIGPESPEVPCGAVQCPPLSDFETFVARTEQRFLAAASVLRDICNRSVV